MKDINVGYLDLANKEFISAVEINKNFLALLSRFVKVKFIPVAEPDAFEGVFKEIGRFNLDYLYVDIYHFFLASFISRERWGLDIPFIFEINSVYYWADRYAKIMPLIRGYDILFTPSDYTRKSFMRISDKFKVLVIPNPLDTDYIRKVSAHNFKERKHKVITFMGRLTSSKGVETLIECMPEINSRIGSAHLNIIGPLSGQGMTDFPLSPYVRKLQNKVKGLRLIKRVHFKGARFGAEKYKLLARSDIFVNPTLAREEASPNVNNEALACGVPVITTNWAGNREVVKHGNNGYLVDVVRHKDKRTEMDTKLLSSLIIKVLQDRRLNLCLRKRAAKSAKGFDYRLILPRLVKSLRKNTSVKAKDRWEAIKDKRVTDFHHLFNKKFLLFLFYRFYLNNDTYALLYEKMPRPDYSKDKIPAPKKKDDNKNAKEKKLMLNIDREYSDFILLENN